MENSDFKLLQYNENYFSVCANALIKANQKMTLREMQLIQIAISQIVRDDEELFTYRTTASELAKFLNVDIRSIYMHYNKMMANLLKNVAAINNDGITKKFQWVSCCEYNKNTQEIKIKLNDELKPFLIGLKKLYTQIELSTLIKFKSYYTLRLYQLLICNWGERKQTSYELSVEELRCFFGVDNNKYKQTPDFVKKTIRTAVDELNSTDLCVISEFKEIHDSYKKGKPIIAISFTADVIGVESENEVD